MKIVLQNLTKKFPGRGKGVREDVVAVKDFTFEIPDGKLQGKKPRFGSLRAFGP